MLRKGRGGQGLWTRLWSNGSGARRSGQYLGGPRMALRCPGCHSGSALVLIHRQYRSALLSEQECPVLGVLKHFKRPQPAVQNRNAEGGRAEKRTFREKMLPSPPPAGASSPDREVAEPRSATRPTGRRGKEETQTGAAQAVGGRPRRAAGTRPSLSSRAASTKRPNQAGRRGEGRRDRQAGAGPAGGLCWGLRAGPEAGRTQTRSQESIVCPWHALASPTGPGRRGPGTLTSPGSLPDRAPCSCGKRKKNTPVGHSLL